MKRIIDWIDEHIVWIIILVVILSIIGGITFIISIEEITGGK